MKAFGQATAAKDAGIAQLRELHRQAPRELPKVGRAYLDDLLGQATADGGFKQAGTVAAKWEKLGHETKRLLYRDPGYINDLDSFFRLAKQMAENANPSGTAHAIANYSQGAAVLKGLLFLDPHAAAIGAGSVAASAAISKLLHSPAGVRLLTKGFRIPVGNKVAAAAWSAELVKASPELGGLLPATASEGDRQPGDVYMTIR